MRDVARHLAGELLGRRDPPTAIFASSDTQALGVLEAVRTAGLRVPGDVSVVGFDDVEVSGYVGLTTVRQPLFESGSLAPCCCSASLGDDEVPGPLVHRLDLELVERSTTAPPKHEYPRVQLATGHHEDHENRQRGSVGNMAQIVLEDVWKVFADGTEAVRAFNLDIADGEFMVLVGPSGCGKTTALRMVAGLETHHARARSCIGDRVVNDLPPKERDIAMVFQNYALYPHMTVFDNMAFGLKLQKVPRAEIETAGAGRCAHPRPRRAAAPQAGGAVGRPARSGWRWAGPSCATRRRS